MYGGLSVFGLAYRYQLIYASKSVKTTRTGMALAIVPILLLSQLLLLIGLVAFQKNTSLDADLVFLWLMKNMLNKELLPLLMLMFFAGLMSSADTNIYAVASHLGFIKKSSNPTLRIRIYTIVGILVATGIAFFWKSIVDITIVGAALQMTLAVPMIYIILNKTNPGRFIGSVTGGIVGLSTGLIAFGPDPMVAILVLAGSLLGLIYRTKEK